MMMRFLPLSNGVQPTHRSNRFLAALTAEDFEYLEPYLETVVVITQALARSGIG